jgi:hypothetical protein
LPVSEHVPSVTLIIAARPEQTDIQAVTVESATQILVRFSQT